MDERQFEERRAVVNGKPVRYTPIEEVASYSGHWVAGKEQNRWSEGAVYKTAKGKIAVELKYHTQWQGELGDSKTVILQNMDEFKVWLQEEMSEGASWPSAAQALYKQLVETGLIEPEEV